MKAAPSGVVGRTTINYHGFRRGAPKAKEERGFLVNDSLRLVTILALRTFDGKKLGVGALRALKKTRFGAWQVELTVQAQFKLRPPPPVLRGCAHLAL